jgi:hypothetical protein
MFIPPSPQGADASRPEKQHGKARPRNANQLMGAALQEPTSKTVKVCTILGGILGLGVALFIRSEYLEKSSKLVTVGCVGAGAILGCFVGVFLQGMARFAHDLGQEVKREPQASEPKQETKS